MSQLENVLEFLETHLDADHVVQATERHKASLTYSNQELCLMVGYPNQRFKPYPYAEAFEDPEKMMHNELLAVVAGAELRDDSLPMIRANYGVGILPSLFGLNSPSATRCIKALMAAGSPPNCDSVLRMMNTPSPITKVATSREPRVISLSEKFVALCASWTSSWAIWTLRSTILPSVDSAALKSGSDAAYCL